MIKNPILVEKNKGSKVILRILSIIIYIMLIPIEFTIIFDAVINKNSISETIIITILFGVYTYYLLVSMSNKKVRALKYIKDYMSYKDVLKHMESQVFRKIEGLNGVFESELWFKIDGYFIPKNFILGMYSITQIARYGRRYQICIVLITGEELMHFVGTAEYNKKNKLKDNFLKTMSEKLPNANISESNSMKDWYEKNKYNIKEKFDKYLYEKKDIFTLINNSIDKSGYMPNKQESVDDSEEYFNDMFNSKKEKKFNPVIDMISIYIMKKILKKEKKLFLRYQE